MVNFDRIAPHYRWLEAIAFGDALQRARLFAIDKLARFRRALIVGEGNGRFLCQFVRAFPGAEIDCVDASGRMLEAAEARLERVAGRSRHRVRFLRRDILSWRPETSYDLVVTHFLLDCFLPNEVETILEKLAGIAADRAVWLLADFDLPAGGLRRAHAAVWLKTMYIFFRAAAGIQANKLVDAAPYLEANGFHCRSRLESRLGLLKSEIWTRDRLKNHNGIANADEILQSSRIPVRQANAAVTGGPADGLGIIGSVNADPGLVQGHP